MTLDNTNKLAKHIFRLLKVTEIVIPIGRTNKGNLGLKFSQNSEDFEIFLDAVPLSTKDLLNDENNIELKKMLEKYLFDKQESSSQTIVVKYPSVGITTAPLVKEALETVEKKKRGRPAKAKK